MPARRAFAYSILRVVPRIDRGECVNVGVVVFCREHGFLGARIEVDEARLLALAPSLDVAGLRAPLQAISAVVAGAPEGGALSELPPSERFGWAAAPSSTVIQPSPIHTGLTDDPAATLEHLFHTLVTV